MGLIRCENNVNLDSGVVQGFFVILLSAFAGYAVFPDNNGVTLGDDWVSWDMYVCMYVCMYARMYVCMHVCV